VLCHILFVDVSRSLIVELLALLELNPCWSDLQWSRGRSHLSNWMDPVPRGPGIRFRRNHHWIQKESMELWFCYIVSIISHLIGDMRNVRLAGATAGAALGWFRSPLSPSRFANVSASSSPRKSVSSSLAGTPIVVVQLDSLDVGDCGSSWSEYSAIRSVISKG
jgi:hypothetical protein